jgi:diamine N-acetyltransferase
MEDQSAAYVVPDGCRTAESTRPRIGRIKGRFVDLRLLNVADAEITFGWRQGPRARYLHSGAITVEEQRLWIASRPNTDLVSEYNFIIERKDGRPLGMVSLSNIDFVHRHAEPGRFLIGDEEAAQGLPAAVEAMKLLYELAFDTLRLTRVFGTVAERNHPMIKWQKYLGMREEGRQRKHLFIDGEFQDAICFGLLEEEYRALTLPRMQKLISLGAGAAFQNGRMAGVKHG